MASGHTSKVEPPEASASAAPGAGTRRRSRVIEFDLSGVVGVRLEGAAAAERDAVGRQLGLEPTTLVGEPDIVIRFVDSIRPAGRLRLLGLRDTAFDDDGFLVLRGAHKSSVRVRIPLDQVGERCEVVCERGLSSVPLLVPLVNMRALSLGAVPLHASSFVHEGTGVVVTGWTKGGKTEALLAFTSHGAEYVGDEWIYVLPEGDRVLGLPEPIRLWDWHLRQLPSVRAKLSTGDQRRLGAFRTLERSRRAAARRNGRVAGVAARLGPLVERQLGVDVDPRALFSAQTLPREASFDRLFFVVTHASDEITVEPADPIELARRMVFSLEYERLDLRAAYLSFRFAFPDAANDLLARAEALQRETLEHRFAGKPAYVVHHPYPVDLARLYDAMRPYCV